MRKFILAVALAATLALTSYAQFPGIAAQNSLSYATATSTNDVLADRGLVSFYPTGGPTFSVLNNGPVTQGGGPDGMGGKIYEAPDGLSTATVRVVYSWDNWSTRRYAGYITYLSPTQINFVALGTANDVSPDYGGPLGVVTLNQPLQFRVEKRACQTNCPWAAITNAVTLRFVSVSPHAAVYYNGAGGPWVIADLYCSLDGLYIKGTTSGPNARLYDGTNPASAYHPGTHAGAQTVLAIYGTGAQSDIISQVCFYDVKYNGATPADYYVGFFNTSFWGVFQFNSTVPTWINSSTTIQLGGGRSIPFGGCNIGGAVYGNTFKLENVI